MQQDTHKTNPQLLDELSELRQRNSELETMVSNLKESEERFRTIANYSFDWENWIGTDGKLMWVNPAVEKLTGYSPGEYLNLPDRIKQIFGDDDRVRAQTHIENGLIHHQSENDVEFQLRRKDGSLKWVSISSQPMYTEKGECLGLRSSIRDISKRKQQEEVLKESEERFKAVAASSPDAILISDQNGAIVFWNNAAAEMFGYEEGGIIGKSYAMLLPERLRDQDQKAGQEYFKTGMLPNNKQPLESIARRKDGSEFPIETTFSSWKVQGQYCFSFILRDITERKRTEALLRESEKRFKDIFDFAIDGILIADSQTRKFQGANEAICRMLGYSLEELINLGVENIHPDENLPSVFEYFEKMAKGTNSRAIELPTQRKDGSVFYADVNAHPLILEGKQCLVGIFRDVTERKQQEEALGEREERFRTITESSPAAIITADSSGKILLWNKAAETIYGYKAKEIVGKPIELLRPEGKRLVDRKNRENFIKTGHSLYIGKTVEGQARKKDGTEFLSETSTSSFKINGKIMFCGIVRDITERNRMEQELQKAHDELEKKVKQRTAELAKTNKELQASRDYLKKFSGKLLAIREEERRNLSTTLHDELGSMAVSVNSQINIAEEEVKAENRNAALKALGRGKAALQKAVGDLRRLAVDLRPPNLESMGLSVVLTDFLNKAKEHAKFKINFSDELGNKKVADANAIVIYRLTQEALTNITKHAKAKHVRVRLYADKKNINIEIADDGVGFNQDKAASRKGNVTLKIGIEGMRERVESLGGEFIITSAPKQGTQIKASLPKK